MQRARELTQGARTVYDVLFCYGEESDGGITLWYLVDTLGISRAEAMHYIRELDASGAAWLWQRVNDDETIYGIRLTPQPRVNNSIPSEIRLDVLERDGWLCGLCGLAG